MANISQALDNFRRGTATMKEALRGVTEDEATFVTAPGKWTIRQFVRLVADTEIVVAMRMRQIIAEDRPTLIPFDQELWAAHLGYATADVADSLSRFSSLRDDTAAVLCALAPEAFERVGIHPERGAKTLLEWVTLFGNHVETHANQVRGIRELFAGKG